MVNDKKEEMRIPIRFIKSVHPVLHEVISNTPQRYRSERIRVLMEKGLLFEAKIQSLASGALNDDPDPVDLE